jgi:quercetin dioxygenase-like cupin family protein
MYDPDLKAYEDVLAARYALGVAGAAEITIAERRLAVENTFADRVARYDALFSELDCGIEAMAPPPGMWDRIEQAVDDFEKSPLTQTVRPDAMRWEPFADGIQRKVLQTDATAGMQIVLYKVAPGTSFAAHGHLINEECLVLDGEIEVDGVVARAGDLHIAFANTRHGVLTSRTGALLYIRADLEMQA